MTSRVNGPITMTIVDDYDVVLMGLDQRNREAEGRRTTSAGTQSV